MLGKCKQNNNLEQRQVKSLDNYDIFNYLYTIVYEVLIK